MMNKAYPIPLVGSHMFRGMWIYQQILLIGAIVWKLSVTCIGVLQDGSNPCQLGVLG